MKIKHIFTQYNINKILSFYYKQEMQKASSVFSTPYSSLLSSEGYCNICYTPYNIQDHQPLLICRQNHCICKACLKQLINNLRCPFCREGLKLDRIRLNKTSAQLIKIKDNAQAKRKFLKITQNQRLVTANDQQEFININELVDEHYFENLENQRQQSCLRILIFIQLFLLQFPLGMYAFFTGLFNISNVCYDRTTLMISASLRDILLIQGYLECIIGLLTAYFTAFHYLRLFQYSSLVLFYFTLLVTSQIKSLLCLTFYYQIFEKGYQMNCGFIFQKYCWVNLATNFVQIILGAYLTFKYYKRR